MNGVYRATEKDICSKMIRLLQKKGYHISGVTRHKNLLREGVHADIVVMVGPNRYAGLKFKSERKKLTWEEEQAVKKNIFTVIRGEDDLYALLGRMSCGGCTKGAAA